MIAVVLVAVGMGVGVAITVGLARGVTVADGTADPPQDAKIMQQQKIMGQITLVCRTNIMYPFYNPCHGLHIRFFLYSFECSSTMHQEATSEKRKRRNGYCWAGGRGCDFLA